MCKRVKLLENGVDSRSYFPDSISLFWILDPIEHSKADVIQLHSGIEIFRLFLLGPFPSTGFIVPRVVAEDHGLYRDEDL